jgi:hypothetical protein
VLVLVSGHCPGNLQWQLENTSLAPRQHLWRGKISIETALPTRTGAPPELLSARLSTIIVLGEAVLGVTHAFSSALDEGAIEPPS